MTALLPTTAPPVAAPPAVTTRDLLRLPWRLVRRGLALLSLAVLAYMAMEVAVFRATYPTPESLEQLRTLSSSGAVRMMQGDATGIDSAGGYAVWDAGWMLLIIVGSWALLTVTRLTRGEEDAGRADLVLAGRVTSQAPLRASLTVLGTCSAVVGAAAALPLVLLGEAATGALLWGVAVAGFTAVMAALGAAVSQLVEPRRRAVSACFALLVGAYLVRVVAHSSEQREWLLWLTPFGWVDKVRVFTDDHWWWLAAPLLAAVALAVVALALRGRRDTGSALLRERASRRTSRRLLGSAPALGWRLTQGTLVAWAVVLGAMSVVFGLMTDALLDFVNEDEGYRKTLESLGVDVSEPLLGFLSYLAVSIAVTVAAFTGFRLGALRQEEAEGRLDNLLVRGVVRWRWLALSALHAVLAAAVLVAVCTVATWAGARTVDAPVGLRAVVEPMAGTLPLLVLFVGLAVLVFAVAPRLTTVVPVTVAVATYLLDTLGTALSWPSWAVALSPFHHLARLPGDPMSALAAIVMTGTGLGLVALGAVAFSRRDLQGP